MKTVKLTRRAAIVAAAAVPLWGCGRPLSAVEGGFSGVQVERGHLLRDPSKVLRQTPAVTHRTGVLIAGGGVAGLAAARALRQRGQEDFAILELEDTAGGNSRAARVGGLPCPLGAHYLPVPGDDAREVQDLLEELGVRQRVGGRWTYDERMLCHSPQERLYFEGEWQEGLLPMQGVNDATLAQYRLFAARVRDVQRSARFTVPALRVPFTPAHAALASQTFVAWLDAQGVHDTHLRWYLDYCCRDDFGAGIGVVSGWAGLHYFASRHGFHAPGDAADFLHAHDSGESAVLTWPEGNGWLTQQMARPLGERIKPARTVLRIAASRHGVEVDAFDHAAQRIERWQAARCIVALPLHVAARVVENAPQTLRDANAATPHASWLVANLLLREPLRDRPGAPPSWDNVLYGSAGLGYVDARHQSLDPRPGPTVLTWYRALGIAPELRRELLMKPFEAWRDEIMAELSVAHPDIAAKAARMEITRYGHAMATPVPHPRPWQAPAVVRADRLLFAHSDWSGYSIFEEAFTRGHLAGAAVAA